jgi:hypothetical protein
MHFMSSDAAKEYVCQATSRVLSPTEIDERISEYKQNAKNALTDDDKDLYVNQLSELEEWKNSDDYKNGRYSRGVDELIIDAIEWRAAVYAFQKTNFRKTLFQSGVFFGQWYQGGIYVCFSVVGKLASRHKDDSSLRAIWNRTSDFILEDNGITKDEYDFIDEVFRKDGTRFTNNQSNTILFRNKVIAHNESMPNTTWDDFDQDLKILVRIWSLLVSWSSFGIIEPFRTHDEAFSGLEKVFDTEGLKQLREKRQDYLDMVTQWAKCFLHNGEIDQGGSVFAQIRVSLTAVPGSTNSVS